MSGPERAVLRSYAAEQVLEYLRVQDAALAHNALLARVNSAVQAAAENGDTPPALTLDRLRIPLSVVPYDAEAEARAAQQREGLRGVPGSDRVVPESEPEDGPGGDPPDRDALQSEIYAGPGRGKDSRPEPLDDVEPGLHRGVIVGDPGSGKSEWLRVLARRAGQEASEGLLSAEALPSEICLPVFVHLREVGAALADEAARNQFLAEIGVEPDHDTAGVCAAAILLAARNRWRSAREDLARRGQPDVNLNAWPKEAFGLLWRKLVTWQAADTTQEPALLCLDGWDEAGDEHDRELLAAHLRELSKLTQARIFLTSRVVGYGDNPLFDASRTGSGRENADRHATQRELRLCAFDIMDTERFIEAFYAGRDEQTGRELVAELRTKHTVSGMAQNPLLCTLLAIAYRPDLTKDPLPLPIRRGPLYEAILEGLFGEWDRETKNTGLGPTATAGGAPVGNGAKKTLTKAQRLRLIPHKFRLLEALAEEYFPHQMITPEELETFLHGKDGDGGYIGDLADTNLLRKLDREAWFSIEDELCEDGVLVRIGSFAEEWRDRDSATGRYMFIHLTFQEYLVGRALGTRANEEGYASIAELVNRKSWHPAWEEAVILMAGMLKDPEPLLARLSNDNLDDPPEDRNDILHHRTILAALCLPEIKEEIRDRPDIQDLIATITTTVVDGAFGEREFSGVLIHYRRMLPAIATANGRYAGSLFHDWLAKGIVKRERARIELVGVCGAPAMKPEIINQLISSLQDEDRKVRQWAAVAVCGIGPAAAAHDGIMVALASLLQDKDGDVWRSAARAVGGIGAAAAGHNRFMTTLAALLQEEDGDIQQSAVRAVGEIGPEAAGHDGIMTTLAALLQDEDRNVVMAVIHAVGGTSEAELRKRATDLQVDYEYLRDRLDGVIRGIGAAAANHDGIMTALAGMLEHEDWDVRSAAARAVGNLGAAAAGHDGFMAALATKLQDEDGEVRAAAADAVGGIGAAATGHDGIMAALNALLEAGDRDVESAAYAVRGIGAAAANHDGIMTALATLLQDEDLEVRAAAADAVGGIGPAAAGHDGIMTALTALLRDEDRNFRSLAGILVGEIGPAAAAHHGVMAALNALLEAGDRDVDLAAYAVRGIGAAAAGHDGIMAALAALLEDEDWAVRRTAADAVRGIGAAAASHDGIMTTLAALLEDDDWDVRRTAADAVRGIGAAAAGHEGFMKTLAALMQDEGRNPRQCAVDMVRKIGAAAAGHDGIMAALAARLEDKDRHVRSSAAYAVRGIGAAAAGHDGIMAALAALLEDEDWDVRRTAADAVRGIGAAAAGHDGIMAALVGVYARDGQRIKFDVFVRWQDMRVFARQNGQALTVRSVNELAS